MVWNQVSAETKKVAFVCPKCETVSLSCNLCSSCGSTNLIEIAIASGAKAIWAEITNSEHLSVVVCEHECAHKDLFACTVCAHQDELRFLEIKEILVNKMPFVHCPKCGYFKECRGKDGYPTMLSLNCADDSDFEEEVSTDGADK